MVRGGEVYGGGSSDTHQIQALTMPAESDLRQWMTSAVIAFGGQISFYHGFTRCPPHFFPGGDIGRIAVCGTINESCNEWEVGRSHFPVDDHRRRIPKIDDLARIVASMDDALGEAGANLVTGDTKVMEKGALDGYCHQYFRNWYRRRMLSADNGLVRGM